MGGTKEGGLPTTAGCVSGSIIPGTGATDGKKRLCTDAGRYGLNVALLQFEGEDKGWFPVGFATRTMKGEEPQYTTA
jgi:hypothetical protein